MEFKGPSLLIFEEVTVFKDWVHIRSGGRGSEEIEGLEVALQVPLSLEGCTCGTGKLCPHIRCSFQPP